LDLTTAGRRSHKMKIKIILTSLLLWEKELKDSRYIIILPRWLYGGR
jgi:hypothetical protein